MTARQLALTLALSFAAAAAAGSPVSGIDLANFDRNVRYQDDLYGAVNGRWVRLTDIPADQSSFGAFIQLRDLSEKQSLILIRRDAAATDSRDPDRRKIADLYLGYMGVLAIESAGLRPLSPQLAAIAAIDSQEKLLQAFGRLQASPLDLPLRLSVAPDARNADTMLLQVGQGGLGLPDRDYYLAGDQRFAAVRHAYLDYLQRLFALTGTEAPQARAGAVMALETRLARAQWDKVANRNPQKTYNRLTRLQLRRLTPGFDWDALLPAAGVGQVQQLNLAQPSYATRLELIVRSTPLPVWRDYLTARLLDAYAPNLSKPFVDAHFALHDRALSGIQQQKPRWKRAVARVEHCMGEALGREYVAAYFPPESKARIDRLVANLMTAYRQSIDTLAWMTPATRKAAQEKLAKYRVKIGYPARWRDYGALTVRRDDPVGNVERCAAFGYRRDIAKLGRPVDRDEWQMTPQTVNAYYEPSMNEIVFPAGILQPPFFNPQADDAVNYGAIGAVIGHEISHGFDDEGSQYDGNGNLRNWWSAEDRARFAALTARLVEQYQAYEPLPGQRVNGRLTLGENIADNAGLAIAYKAYRLSLGGHEAPVIDGLTGDQRFFIGFAQVWRSKVKDEQLLKQLVSDPHTPAMFRPAGAAVNADAFHQAFGTRPGDRMYKAPEDRIRLW